MWPLAGANLSLSPDLSLLGSPAREAQASWIPKEGMGVQFGFQQSPKGIQLSFTVLPEDQQMHLLNVDSHKIGRLRSKGANDEVWGAREDAGRRSTHHPLLGEALGTLWLVFTGV